MGDPHPLRHLGFILYGSNATRSGLWSAVCCHTRIDQSEICHKLPGAVFLHRVFVSVFPGGRNFRQNSYCSFASPNEKMEEVQWITRKSKKASG